jgi:hypothetical protein
MSDERDDDNLTPQQVAELEADYRRQDHRAYAMIQMASAMGKQLSAPASAAQHEFSAMLALLFERVPLPQEHLDFWAVLPSSGLESVLRERLLQTRLGYDAAHDDAHTCRELANFVRAKAAKVMDLGDDWGHAGSDSHEAHQRWLRQRFVEMAAVALAAIEKIDRGLGVEEKDAAQG